MRTETRQDYHERMLRVLVYIQQHLDEELGLETLAGVAHFSPFHFHRIFRGMIGESLQAHVRRLRLERAARRLRSSRDPVLRIALEAGFESHAAFARAFKAMTGQAPSAWRRGATSLPAARSGVQFHPSQDLPDFHPLTEELATMDVSLIEAPARRVAFVRHTGPYDQCQPAWETLCATLGREGRLGADSQFIGLCHDDPEVTPPERIRYDACVTVGDDFRPSGEVGVQDLPSGACARFIHQGPFDGLKHTYGVFFGQWLPDSGRRCIDGPSMEVHLNDPASTRPEDLRVEILVPLEA